jgi:hypothetical protein
VVGEGAVGRLADALDVVRGGVEVVVVERRRVDADHDVVDDRGARRVRPLGGA